jgi:hypothetical protein
MLLIKTNKHHDLQFQLTDIKTDDNKLILNDK